MRLLVTGASGFVGGRVCERAAERGGITCHGLGRRELTPPPFSYARVDLAAGPEAIAGVVPWQPDAVIHAAARAAPWGRRADYEHDNVAATRAIVDYCRAAGRPRLVYVSSSSVLYRDGDQFDLAEDASVGPRFVNHYAATKAAGERIVAAYEGSWVVARPRAVIGPGDTVLFPRILAAARVGRLPRLVRRGEPARGDLIYIDNLADYLLQLARRPELGGVYHLTNAEPVEIQAVLAAVLEALGLRPPRRRVPVALALRVARGVELLHRLSGRPGEPPVTRYGVGVLAWSKTFDVSRMLADLGPPRVSLADGLAAFIAWQREQS